MQFADDGESCDASRFMNIVRQLAKPWVGYQRGYIRQADSQAEIAARPKIRNGEDITIPDVSPALTDNEVWLRTGEAYDAVVQYWMDLLETSP
jgi:hypothetical protein